jgi:3'-5' exoribonuclease
LTAQPTVSAFAKDTRFEGFLLVRSSEQRAAASGSRYLDMTLCDRTGEVNAKLWDGAFAPPAIGSVLKVRASIIEYNGRLQMRVEKLAVPVPEDNVDLSTLTPCAPEPSPDMLAQINLAIARMRNPDLLKLCRALVDMAGADLMYYPAAQRLHHAVYGGLLYHTLSMLRAADAILPLYPWLDGDLLRAGVIAHDLAKTAELKSDALGNVSDYTADGLLIGHLVRGVTRVREAAAAAGVTGEYVMLLEHMVISHHGEAEYGSPRPPMFPEAEMLHWLDVVDARMNEMQGVLNRTPRGSFSEKIWSLERRLYHPDYFDKDPDPEIPGTGPALENMPALAAARPAPRPDPGKAYNGLL